MTDQYEPEELTVKVLERESGLLVHNWEGQCYGMALEAVKLLRGAAHAVYGHWTGPMRGFWHTRAGMPFVQHGWVALDGGRVLDPTRWSFEAVEPYIYVGPPDFYDEGGNRWRATAQRPAPKRAESNRGKHLLKLSAYAARHVALLIGAQEVLFRQGGVEITEEQIFWLANAPYHHLEPHVHEIYQAITGLGLIGFVPFDNRVRAVREYGPIIEPATDEAP